MSIVDDILAAKRNIEQRIGIVYTVSEALSPGKVLMADETEWSHAYIVFHSEAEAQDVARHFGLPLVHLRDMPIKMSPPLDEVRLPSHELERHYRGRW